MYVLCIIPKNRKENNNLELELQDGNPLNLMNILHDDDKGGLISEFFSPKFLAKNLHPERKLLYFVSRVEQ